MHLGFSETFIGSLASAAVGPSADSNVELILICSGVVALTAVLAFIPIYLAARHRQREIIVGLLVLWGLALAGSVSYSVMQQMDWSTAYNQRIETGYSDPQDLSDEPALPVTLWSGLAAAYLGLVIWARIGGAKANR
jgi:ABC-type uncharacterized transport system permease subunit